MNTSSNCNLKNIFHIRPSVYIECSYVLGYSDRRLVNDKIIKELWEKEDFQNDFA